ncbi:hypothetical protein GCM10025876_12490 [Demequina litorisediminis]|uniref:Uncharacterized protein n=1 Tax=Demequina litorisediminis TaxID=1849022 RepID=A0ABQ6IBD1_9MICO|nr:hypothetical protein GCM10025876_12490 [Demequina litorisediminis]
MARLVPEFEMPVGIESLLAGTDRDDLVDGLFDHDRHGFFALDLDAVLHGDVVAHEHRAVFTLGDDGLGALFLRGVFLLDRAMLDRDLFGTGHHLDVGTLGLDGRKGGLGDRLGLFR